MVILLRLIKSRLQPNINATAGFGRCFSEADVVLKFDIPGCIYFRPSI